MYDVIYSAPLNIVGSVIVWRGSGVRSRGPGFKTTGCSLQFWIISFTPLSEETIKAVDPFYLVSMLREVKYPTQGNGKTIVDSLTLENDILPCYWVLRLDETETNKQTNKQINRHILNSECCYNTVICKTKTPGVLSSNFRYAILKERHHACRSLARDCVADIDACMITAKYARG